MNIRLAEQEDCGQCFELDAAVTATHPRRQFLEQRIRRRRMYLALDDSRIVGLITFQTNFIDCLYISLVIVHPDFRRRGIARALIERVAAHSQNGKLFSSAEIDNEASIRMHRALGFQPSGYIDNLPQEKRELIFSRDLAPHACGEPFP